MQPICYQKIPSKFVIKKQSKLKKNNPNNILRELKGSKNSHARLYLANASSHTFDGY
jgi:hypothetical protein